MRTFQEDQSTGPYEPLQDGDPLTYAASFVDNETVPVPRQLPLHYDGAWQDLNFFERKELNITVFAQEIEEETEDGELVGEDEPSLHSRIGSTLQASAAGSHVTLEDQEQLGDLDCAPMTDFQWEQKLKCCYPKPGDRLYRHFTYHETTFPLHEGYLNLVANAKDHQNLANNPMGTKDAIDEMFFEERVTTVNVEILATVVTYDEQKRAKEDLTVREMNMQRPDYAAQNVVSMIMQ